MALPDDKALLELQKQGDGETDPLLGGLVQKHGEEKLAALLEWLIAWRKPAKPYPTAPAGMPPEIYQAAIDFLDKPNILDGAYPKVDWDRVNAAQAFYKSHQSLGLLILGCGSLPACYSIPGIANVLMGSGRLSLQVQGRLMETILFLTEVMKPGTLGTGGTFSGNLWVRKVRLMHGVMRCLMLADPKKFGHRVEDNPGNFLLRMDFAAKSTPEDFPIDQVELGFVLLTFSWIVIRGFDELGVDMTQQQRDDHIYAWSVIGYGLGIVPEMRPDTADGAKALFTALTEKYEEGTESGRLLVAALVVYIIFRLRQGIREILPPRLLAFLVKHFKRFGSACLESVARTFVRTLTGKDTANRLWVPRAPFIHWIVGQAIRGMLVLKDKLESKAGDKGIPRLLGDHMKPY